nr:L,D-transpeptidase [Aquibacillus albus]
MFHPNVPQYSPGHSSPIPFQPVEVFVEKETYSLFVKSFPYIILQKQVGLGINNSTPKGTFTIEERVLNPNGKTEDMFGEAGLGMGEIAIHGTYDVKSINNQESLGCIRLLNPDILDVFNFVPKGTAVHIDNKTPSITGLIPIKNRELLIPSVQQRTIQTTDTTFDWAG